MRALEQTQPGPFRLLVRHADAGVRAEWKGADDWRVLSPLGRAQAEEVAARVGHVPILRVLSSPALRCRQTVVPLTRNLVLEVESRSELAIDADPHQLIRFLRDPETEAAVLCTHRETLERLFAQLVQGRMVVPGGAPTMEMAAAWLLLGNLGDITGELRYLPARPRRHVAPFTQADLVGRVHADTAP